MGEALQRVLASIAAERDSRRHNLTSQNSAIQGAIGNVIGGLQSRWKREATEKAYQKTLDEVDPIPEDEQESSGLFVPTPSGRAGTTSDFRSNILGGSGGAGGLGAKPFKSPRFGANVPSQTKDGVADIGKAFEARLTAETMDPSARKKMAEQNAFNAKRRTSRAEAAKAFASSGGNQALLNQLAGMFMSDSARAAKDATGGRGGKGGGRGGSGDSYLDRKFKIASGTISAFGGRPNNVSDFAFNNASGELAAVTLAMDLAQANPEMSEEEAYRTALGIVQETGDPSVRQTLELLALKRQGP